MHKNEQIFLGTVQDLYITTSNGQTIAVAARSALEAVIVRAYYAVPSAVYVTVDETVETVLTDTTILTYSLTVVSLGRTDELTINVSEAKALDTLGRTCRTGR